MKRQGRVSYFSMCPTAACNRHISHHATSVQRRVCGSGDASEAWACYAMAEIARGHARAGKYGGWADAMLR